MVAQIDTKYRAYGLGKTLRRLVSYSFFEGRPHTTKGQWFNPIVFAFLRGLKTIPGHPSLNKPIFITGLGRSGTTILGIILSLHKDVGFLNEPKAIWVTADPRHDINGDYTQSDGIYKLEKNDVTADITQSLHRIFSRYLRTVKSSRLIDKYPELIFRISYLLSAFDDPKIIFISRCGVDAVHSIDLWSKRLGVKVGDSVDDWWGRNDIKWRYLQDQILFRDEQYSSVKDLASAELDHQNRAALEWIITMREGLENLEKYPNAIHHIGYEDLVRQPAKELSAILKHCDLVPDESVMHYASEALYQNTSKPWPTLLPPIEHLFSETMIQLGYDPSNYEKQ